MTDMYVTIQSLPELHVLASTTEEDRIHLTAKMSGIEKEAADDLLQVAPNELRRFKHHNGGYIGRAAFVGTAHGVAAIAALRLFQIESMIVTDILAEILAPIEQNVRDNTEAQDMREEINFVADRDCEPVPEGCDLISANLPLVMTSSDDLATTTLTDASAYERLAEGDDDPLVKWSLLSQLGFLVSAKRKLKPPTGSVITLSGGRIPDSAIAECSRRAGMTFERRTVSVMRQGDEEHVEHYARYEATISRDAFLFYDETEAASILEGHSYAYPAIVHMLGERVREILSPAALTAAEAWNSVQSGNHVAHLSYGFRASPAT